MPHNAVSPNSEACESDWYKMYSHPKEITALMKMENERVSNGNAAKKIILTISTRKLIKKNNLYCIAAGIPNI